MQSNMYIVHCITARIYIKFKVSDFPELRDGLLLVKLSTAIVWLVCVS